ncbi:cellulose binding domain-containing protein [Glycomyces artemisiae]|uniref:Cellulose binding domain-containing protein n=1 Tax=Glycomyces artemisiae TaxID=1076443 RepID=A0A2T0U823_9ACTN|nr:cellulose binding domain-containing protein [Glycomyces artemisiae]PRY54064.1 cellulose binding domain-containing protein [Glycomyces artemisiae]
MHRSEPEPQGRLHGRLLQILGAFSGVVALIAMWQLGVFGGDSDREPVSAVDGPTTEWPSAAEDGSSAAAVAETASSALETPSESVSEAQVSESPSESSTSDAPPRDTEAPQEEEATVEGAACVAYLSLDEEWQGSIGVSVEVVNVGDERLETWEIDLDLDDVDIFHYWNMDDLGRGWFGAKNWNGRLDPGEDAVTGFQAEVDDRFDLPDSVPCTAYE